MQNKNKSYEEYIESDILKSNPQLKAEHTKLYQKLRTLENCLQDEYQKPKIDRSQIEYYEEMIKEAHGETVEFSDKHGLTIERIEKIRDYLSKEGNLIKRKKSLQQFDEMVKKQNLIRRMPKPDTSKLSNQDRKYLDMFLDFYIETYKNCCDPKFSYRRAETCADAKWRFIQNKQIQEQL